MRTTAQSGAVYAAGTYTTDTEVMSAAASYTENVGQQMTDAVDRLMTYLSDLPSGWAGPAANAFYGPDGAQDHWHRKHRELIDACNQIAAALNQSAQGYDTSEQDNTTAVRNATPL